MTRTDVTRGDIVTCTGFIAVTCAPTASGAAAGFVMLVLGAVFNRKTP